MIHTPLCDLLGIRVPIMQAPIQGSPALTAAVAEAGAFGMLGVGWHTLDDIRQVVRETRERTGRPFGANLVLWEPQHERLAVLLEERVGLVSIFWGDAAPYIPAIHAAGALAAVTIGSAEEAYRAAQAGADLVVAQGWEAGGHVWGRVATLPLVPAVVDAVAPLPVVAAGGVGDGRGLAAVLVLGGAGIWIGSRFIASCESEYQALYKQRIVAAAETEPLHGDVFDAEWKKAPHRVLVNSTVQGWLDAGSPAGQSRPGAGEIIAWTPDGDGIERYSIMEPAAELRGDTEALAMYAGQSAGVIRAVQPVQEIVTSIVETAERSLKRLSSSLDHDA